MLERARAEGFPLRAVDPDDHALAAGGWDLLVWDSLLLDRVDPAAARRTILLLHYLPSLDPRLDASARAALQEAERRSLRRADRVLAAGAPVADAARALVPGATVHVCEPGVAPVFLQRRPRAAAGPGDGAPVTRLLTAAHLLPGKGHAHLVDILGDLRELAWHWHVVGDDGVEPALARALRERAGRAGIGSRITWHGALEQAELAGLMARCDLFVFPSLFEAYGTVLAEAAAAGMPVLSTRVGAAGDLVRHGVSGLLVEVGDWGGLAGHLRLLLLEPERLAALRGNADALPVRGWEDAFREFRAICEDTAAPG